MTAKNSGCVCNVRGIGIKRFQKVLTYFFAVGSLTGIGGVVFLNRVVIAEGLNGWQVLPQPERLSELYFTHPQKLPDSLTSSSSQKISFTVRNLEHRISTYHFTITAISEESGTEYPLDKGAFTLDHDSSQTIYRDVTLPSLSGRTLIKIDLNYDGIAPGNSTVRSQSQSIHYWATLTPRQDGV